MRRWTVFILAILTLGVTTTVAVAWFFAAIHHPVGGRNRLSSFTNHRFGQFNGWEVQEDSGPAKRWRLLRALRDERGWSPACIEPTGRSIAWSRPPEPGEQLFEDESGWPFLSMQCCWRWPENPLIEPDEYVDGGIPILGLAPSWMFEFPPPTGNLIHYDEDYIDMDDRRALPLVPVWPGFLGSTLVFSLAWIIVVFLISAPASLRRWQRGRRNACRTCGYLLHGTESDRCPECGIRRGLGVPLLTSGRISIAVALVIGVLSGSISAVGWLIARSDALPPIFRAARHGDSDEIRALIERGVDPDMEVPDINVFLHWSGHSTTPTMWAASHGHVEAVKALLECGATPDLSQWDWWRALHWACAFSHTEVVRVLLSAGADVNAGVPPPLLPAVQSRDPEIVRLLLETGARVDPEANSPLFEAVDIDVPEIVRLLLEAGADPNRKHPEDWMLNEWGSAPLERAVLRGDVEVVHMLLDAGADPHIVQDGAGILFAIDWDVATPEFLDLLFSLGLDVNSMCDEGNTPLMRAVVLGAVKGVRRLIDEGADPTISNVNGYSSLDYAERPNLKFIALYEFHKSPEPNPEIIAILREAAIKRELENSGE